MQNSSTPTLHYPGLEDVHEHDVRYEPLASCVTPTANRRRFLPQAIHYFLGQDYSNKELIIGCPAKRSLAKNAIVLWLRARGEIIVHWDDDNWSAPWRRECGIAPALSLLEFSR